MTPSGLSIVKVVAFHQKYAADVLDLTTGARIPRVRIASGEPVSTNSGAVATPEPTKGDEDYSPFATKDRDIYGLLAYAGNVPILMGFLHPQVCQLFFDDLARSVRRHASDVYTTTDGEGNVEVYHPSGTFIRIATDPEHEDLTGRDVDGKWKIDKNTDKAVHVRLVVANGGAVKADLHLDPQGNVKVEHQGDLTANTGGSATVDIAGDASVKVAGSITSQAASWTHTGPVTFTDNVQVDKTLTATTDVVGGGKSLKGHTHGGVASGTASTTAPQ